MSNRRDETIPLNVDENKNAILPEKNGLSGSQNSVGTWAEWDKDSVYLFFLGFRHSSSRFHQKRKKMSSFSVDFDEFKIR